MSRLRCSYFGTGPDVVLNELPNTQGIYLLFDGLNLLYVGETTNFEPA